MFCYCSQKQKVSNTEASKPIGSAGRSSDINVGASTSCARNLRPTSRSRASADQNVDSDSEKDSESSDSDSDKDSDSNKENESQTDFLKTKLTVFLKDQQSLKEWKPHIAIVSFYLVSEITLFWFLIIRFFLFSLMLMRFLRKIRRQKSLCHTWKRAGCLLKSQGKEYTVC